MDFSFMRKFFVLSLGLYSDKFHYNIVCSKGTVISCYIKQSDIWELTQYIMYNIKIHKVLQNGSENKNYTII